jgi:hypothetical protein
MTDATDVSEQITGAVSGEWWHGANPDGEPAGYRVVSVKGDEVDTLYKGTGDERTIDPGLTPIVNGVVELAVKIKSKHGSIAGPSYQVDDSQPVFMPVENGQPWAVAAASWDTTSLAEGYHQITLRATDSSGSFQKQVEVKVSATETVSVSELTSHLRTYQGSYVALTGTASVAMIGPSSTSGIPEGMGLLLISDNKDMAVVIAGECFSPPLAGYKPRLNDQVIVKVVPIRISMDFLTSTREYDEYYSKIKDNIDYIRRLISSSMEGPKENPVAVWGARWLSADDLTILTG